MGRKPKIKDKKTRLRFDPDTGFNFVTFDFVRKRVTIRCIGLMPDEDFCVLPTIGTSHIWRLKYLETRWLCLKWHVIHVGRLRPTTQQTSIQDRYGRCYKFVPRCVKGERKNV